MFFKKYNVGNDYLVSPYFFNKNEKYLRKCKKTLLIL